MARYNLNKPTKFITLILGILTAPVLLGIIFILIAIKSRVETDEASLTTWWLVKDSCQWEEVEQVRWMRAFTLNPIRLMMYVFLLPLELSLKGGRVVRIPTGAYNAELLAEIRKKTGQDIEVNKTRKYVAIVVGPLLVLAVVGIAVFLIDRYKMAERAAVSRLMNQLDFVEAPESFDGETLMTQDASGARLEYSLPVTHNRRGFTAFRFWLVGTTSSKIKVSRDMGCGGTRLHNGGPIELPAAPNGFKSPIAIASGEPSSTKKFHCSGLIEFTPPLSHPLKLLMTGHSSDAMREAARSQDVEVPLTSLF